MVFLSAEEGSRQVPLILQGNSNVSSETTIFLTGSMDSRGLERQAEDSISPEFVRKGDVTERSLNSCLVDLDHGFHLVREVGVTDCQYREQPGLDLP